MIAGPPALQNVLEQYHKLIKSALAENGMEPSADHVSDERQYAFVNAMQLLAAPAFQAQLRPFVVHHCRDAFGVAVTLPLRGKNGAMTGSTVIVYSGDTRPCRTIVDEGLRALLAAPRPAGLILVHEATFNDDEFEDAVKKRHSTVGEALGIANDLKSLVAEKQQEGQITFLGTVLTHFSQRYPSVNSGITHAGHSTYISAFDGTIIPLTSHEVVQCVFRPSLNNVMRTGAELLFPDEEKRGLQ
jgi:ribonuclease BN (tRNA processing enzyme)